MAKKPAKAAPEAELDKVAKELERKESALQKLQERLRPDPENAKLRERVQSAKAEIVPLVDRKADLQRAIGKAKGGREFSI